MPNETLTQEQETELAALRQELPKAESRAVEALHSLGPDHILEGEALTRFEDADKEAAAIRQRIAEITGES